jgi:hypothetical protein
MIERYKSVVPDFQLDVERLSPLQKGRFFQRTYLNMAQFNSAEVQDYGQLQLAAGQVALPAQVNPKKIPAITNQFQIGQKDRPREGLMKNWNCRVKFLRGPYVSKRGSCKRDAFFKFGFSRI